jgi:hypothetical protein
LGIGIEYQPNRAVVPFAELAGLAGLAGWENGASPEETLNSERR